MFHHYDPNNRASINTNISNVNINNNNNNNNFAANMHRSSSAPVLIDLSNINDEDEDEVYPYIYYLEKERNRRNSFIYCRYYGNVQVNLVGLHHYSGKLKCNTKIYISLKNIFRLSEQRRKCFNCERTT